LPKEKPPEGGCQFKPDDRGNAGLDYRRYVDPQRSFRMYGHSGKFRVVFDEAPATIARHSKITPFNIAQTALNRLKRPLSRGSGPAVYPAEPLVSYQINRQLSGWNLPPLVIRAFGAHCQ
jgi:hypothetical protein